jgi:hypothetical protein
MQRVVPVLIVARAAAWVAPSPVRHGGRERRHQTLTGRVRRVAGDEWPALGLGFLRPRFDDRRRPGLRRECLEKQLPEHRAGEHRYERDRR